MEVHSGRQSKVEDIGHLIRSMDHQPKGSMGQNFLKDRNIARRIVNCIDVSDVDFLLEIGPGTGILTEMAVDLGFPIVIVEKDNYLSKYLNKRFDGYDVEVINDDIMNHIQTMERRGNFFIFSNLPYNISSSFMGSIIDMSEFSDKRTGFIGGVIMFQKEFGERLIASPSSKKYGKISVTFQNKIRGERIMDVSKEKFIPSPKVDSIVIRMIPRLDWDNVPEDKKLYMRIIDRSFSSRRKKLRNLISPGGIGADTDSHDIQKILLDHEWSDLRPENLSPDDFVVLANEIYSLLSK